MARRNRKKAARQAHRPNSSAAKPKAPKKPSKPKAPKPPKPVKNPRPVTKPPPIPAYGNLLGAGGRLFADPVPGADEATFQVDNTSSQYYNSPYYKLHQYQMQPVPAPSMAQPRMNLSDVTGTDFANAIAAARTISFHAVGDTGAANVSTSRPVATVIAQEAGVADAMAADVAAGGPGAPAFFFHLGDIIYHFGEDRYYYDQFYEPFRGYDRPIFAIPGNHDGSVYGQSTTTPAIPTLQGYLRNFCAPAPGPAADAGALVRSLMTQPGVYFTLDAPFVSIIGLYSNVLEGPGVISSQGGAYPTMNDDQLTFLQAELTRLKPERAAGERAVIVAVHHPPASIDGLHGGTLGLSNDLDSCFAAAGLWPDAVLSGHAHLYQRFSHTVAGLNRTIPYIVSGSGGFAASAPQYKSPVVGTTIDTFTLETVPYIDFGYLTATVDMKGAVGMLTIKYSSVSQAAVSDSITVPIATTTSAASGPAHPKMRRPRRG
ncbi:MAG TPA: metallophosphoesterase [Opitutaceae bacterium]|jgi:hypothetical protein